MSFVLNATQVHYKQPKMPVFVAQGPMNNGAPLHDALQVAIAAINQAGGKWVPRGAARRGAARPNAGAKAPLPPQTNLRAPPPLLPLPPSAIYLDLRGPPNDGCGGHPGVAGHAGMAALAIPAIGAAMGWA